MRTVRRTGTARAWPIFRMASAKRLEMNLVALPSATARPVTGVAAS